MIIRILSLAGGAFLSWIIHLVVFLLTGSLHLGVLMGGLCAMSMGIVAAKDGLWRG